MAQMVHTQLRFYGQYTPEFAQKPDIINTRSDYKAYCEPTVFSQYAPIQQLGIQTLPGTRFYINNGIEPIIIGASGIYEIDLRNTSAIITAIHFSEESMERINNAKNGHLIIDIIGAGGD